MKNIIVIIFFIIVFCGNISAEDKKNYYIVKKGDTLWDISQKEWGQGKFWQEIAKVNKISHPEKMKIGMQLKIPVIETIRIINHNTSSPYNASAIRGDEKVLQAIDKTYYEKELKEELKKTVKETNPTPYILMKGEKVEYFSDKKGIYHNLKGYEFAWKKVVAIPAYVWVTQIDNRKCEILVISGCGNFAARCDSKPSKEETAVIKEIPIPVVEEREETAVIKEIPAVEEKEEEKTAVIKEIPIPAVVKEEPKKSIEHEPIIGAFYWTNKLAQGQGVYGEYMAWLREQYPWGYTEGWSPGIGVFGMNSQGDSKISSYEWAEKSIGPQVGLKYIAKTRDGKPWQWQGKARLVWEKMEGENPESGYSFNQKNLKIGFYTEALKSVDPNWLVGITADGWYAIDRKMNFTWSGDHPGNRTQITVLGLAQNKISKDLSLRLSAGPFYQGWDRTWGTRIGGEIRLWETVMIGSVINITDLTTLTGFVRLELGKPIRDFDKKRRVEKIKQIQIDKENGSGKINFQVQEEP